MTANRPTSHRLKDLKGLPPQRSAAVLLACALGAAVAGCSTVADNMSGAFVDPAKYELYNCVQLRTARKDNAKRLAELTELRAKAETGAAGAVVSDLAYGNDLIATRAQSRLADEVWARNNCEREALPPEKPDPAATAKDLTATGKRSRSGAH